jgi:DNA-binding transcriptional ArsR family regulator
MRQRPHSPARLVAAAPVFAALGDATRLHIVARLCREGPLSIAKLSHGRSVSRQAVTKHLRALERAGLARSRRAGRERVWSLKTKPIALTRSYLDQIAADWDNALMRLKSLVETEASGPANR